MRKGSARNGAREKGVYCFAWRTRGRKRVHIVRISAHMYKMLTSYPNTSIVGTWRDRDFGSSIRKCHDSASARRQRKD